MLLVIDRAAATPATAGAVLRAHRQPGDLNTVPSVATQGAATRYLLEDDADSRGPRLVARTQIDVALDTTHISAA
ncbi:hypothetical protein ACFRH6_35165 [Streptomyces sp. NPDC056749]|uniref:hypothetical protein n=1 Tax=Streptomyces sp. NPDC056749 TaxID=3345936 RepID=UPI0036BC7D8E